MLSFRDIRTLQMFATVCASVSKHFSQERSVSNRERHKAARTAALVEWCGLFTA